MYKPATHQITAFAIFCLIIGTYFILARYVPVLYIWATYEDLIGEWAQTFCFITVCGLSLRLTSTNKQYRIFFALLALASFYVFMEEISWGQRIFGFDSPDVFKQHNLQRETNLHNFLVGPYSTLLKDIVEYTLAAALLIYGLIYPLLLRLGIRPATTFDSLGLAPPPLYLWPFFVMATYLETAPFHFNEAEIAELLVGTALVIMTTHYVWAGTGGLPDSGAANRLAGRQSLKYSLLITGILLLIASSAAMTTYYVYQNPETGAKIDRRLLNGYEKFAGRYHNKGKYDTAADLYLRVHRAEPNRTSLLRRMAKNYQAAGNQELFLYYTNMALEINLGKYERSPDKVSVNLALAKTYRQLGQHSEANKHAKRAHVIALKRVHEKPASARRAYWLARTYQQLGNSPKALHYYRRAFELKPGSKKYRKAYYRMKNR